MKGSWAKKFLGAALVLLTHCSSSAASLEDPYFRSHFNLSKYFQNNHVTMSELKVSESYALGFAGRIPEDAAMSALRGIHLERESHLERRDPQAVEIREWNQLNREEFFRNNASEAKARSEATEKGTKGLPEPFMINNLKDDSRHIQLYFNNEDLETKEFIYKGNYIPKIYNNVLLISIILFIYILSLKNLAEGFIYGKNTAKDFIPVASSLFVFLFSLKLFLMVLPISLSIVFGILLTLNYFKISLDKLDPFDILKNYRIERQPVGWFLTIFMVSLVLANVLYHSLFTVKVSSHIIKYIDNSLGLFCFYLSILVLLATLIFSFISANILPAKKTQNGVFALMSSYLLLSAFTYGYNLVSLHYFRSTSIFQIEPIMFFSFKPKFVFNRLNCAGLCALLLLTLLSLLLPKWIKKLSMRMKLKRKNLDTTLAKYDMFLNVWT